MILVYLLLSLKALPQVIINADELQTLNYISYINKDQKRVPLSDELIKRAKEKIKTSDVIEKFEMAQYQYFSEQQEVAKKLFEELIILGESHLLFDPVSSMISLSYLRRASLEEDHHKQIYWLKRGLIYNPDFLPQKNSISPELWDKWKYLSSQENKIQLSLNHHLNGFNRLFISNQSFDLSKKQLVHWPEGVVTVRLFSNTYQSIEWRGLVSDFLKIKISKEPLVRGDCESFEIEFNYLGSRRVEIFFNPLCVAPLLNKPSLKTLVPAPLDPLENKDLLLKSPLKAPLRAAPFYKNKWFWIGSVTAGLLYSQYLKESESRGPIKILPPRQGSF